VEAAAAAWIAATPVAAPSADAPALAAAHATYRELYPALASVFPKLAS
jgi:hypothetical protein